MTVATTSTTITQSGNGSTTVWTFPFIGVAAGDLIVSTVDPAGTITILLTTQYSVLINAVPVGGLWGIGGSVTYPLSGPALAAGYKLAITRDVPFTQTVSIANQGAFYPQSVEKALDLLELQIQQLSTDYAYALKFPVTDPSPPSTLPSYLLRENGLLGFDANGQPIIVNISSSTPTPGQFATPRKIVTTGTATLNINTNDSFAGVSIYQSSAPITTLQLPTGYGPFPVFDASGNASSFPIKVLPPGGFTIQGLPQFYLAFNYQAQSFANDGTSILVL